MEIDYKQLANRMIDDKIEVYGVSETIEYLYELGYNEHTLIHEFHFDAESVTATLEGREE